MTGGDHVATGAVRPIWMAEDFRELDRDSLLEPFDKAELCLEGVRTADCLVVVLTKRHGTPIKLSDRDAVPSSFFELELFEAALLRKPTFIFLQQGFDPEPRLAQLLRLLEPCFPGFSLDPVSEDHILKRVDRLLQVYDRPKWLRRLPLPRLSTLVDTLHRIRHRDYRVKDEPPPLQFLEGVGDPDLAPPRPKTIQLVLERATAATQHHRRLTFLWLAIRALMGAPFGKAEFRSYVPFWDRALGAWSSSGAWYGLHSHAVLGCLAALGSQARARSVSVASTDLPKVIPHGALASAYYSIAKLSTHRRDLFELAFQHVEASLALGGDVTSGLGVRGSIHLRLHRTEAAIADYRRVAELRSEMGGASYGDALSELGHALVMAGNWRDGISTMEQGRELLRLEPPSGFAVRATRKLAAGYARTLRLGRALELAAEAHDMASTIGALDQIHGAERLAARLHGLYRRSLYPRLVAPSSRSGPTV
ncbi:MAG: hypothetical protein KIT25_11615 [Enhydrobacter sp.]|nr:MAG: hypothetical protein KIT25_11615 [Enhydrobacter sp.]